MQASPHQCCPTCTQPPGSWWRCPAECAAGELRVSPVVRLGWLLWYRGCSRPRAPSPSSEEGDPSGLMGSSCELLSCVDARSASLHSCKVSSRTKRSVSTRGTPAQATWAGEKARCGAEGARTLPCERAMCRCPRCACRPATRQLSHSTFTLCTHPSAITTTCTTCGDPHTTVYDGAGAWCLRDAETYTRYARWLAEPGGSAARAIVLCGKGSSCQRWC
jgi:hypothetical protein